MAAASDIHTVTRHCQCGQGSGQIIAARTLLQRLSRSTRARQRQAALQQAAQPELELLMAGHAHSPRPTNNDVASFGRYVPEPTLIQVLPSRQWVPQLLEIQSCHVQYGIIERPSPSGST
jgi:hypothetical protein